MKLLTKIACGLVILLCATKSQAHVQFVSYFTLQPGESANELQVILKVSEIALTSLANETGNSENTSRLRDHFFQVIDVEANSERCKVVEDSFQELNAAQGFRRFAWNMHCSSRPVAVNSTLFAEIPGHFLIVRGASEAESTLCTLTARDTRCVLPAQGDAPKKTQTPLRVLGLGITHILNGWDHVLFVILLIAIATKLGQVALAASGFTLGHSITLVLASLGWISVVQNISEMLIAASIVVIALDNLGLIIERAKLWVPWTVVALLLIGALALRMPAMFGLGLGATGYFLWSMRRSRPMEGRIFVAAIFGLVHGLGFSSVFRDGALAGSTSLVPLALFNIGVEVGQLAIIAGVWPLVIWLRGKQWHPAFVAGISIVAICLGSYFIASNSLHPAP